jgi:hypothetical protein
MIDSDQRAKYDLKSKVRVWGLMGALYGPGLEMGALMVCANVQETLNKVLR